MKRLLVVHHTLQPPGGGSAVGAWMLQALRGSYDVTVISWEPVDLERVNDAFGTSLRRSDCRWVSVRPGLRKLLKAIPLRLALLTTNLLFREARGLCARQRFDAVVSTANEIDIGTRTIQYIHYPWAYFPRPEGEYRWYHVEPLLLLYRRVSTGLSGYDRSRIPNNVTLVNSDWTGRLYQRWYGAPARTLYPPVAGGFPDIPWEERERGFVCLGRLSPEKEVEKIIDVLARVRARGHDVRLHVVGHVGDRTYARRVYRVAEQHASWITFHRDLPRAQMVRLIARNRYGIHGMVGEHFGIAPAELQRAGCITFVPDDGGPVEIVRHDERVIYHSVEDAVEKIDRVLRDPGHEAAVLSDVATRKDLFSETRFMVEFLEVVEAFVSQPHAGAEGPTRSTTLRDGPAARGMP
jgi:glycosyltransferase involved in cell wall biosynthesis